MIFANKKGSRPIIVTLQVANITRELKVVGKGEDIKDQGNKYLLENLWWNKNYYIIIFYCNTSRVRVGESRLFCLVCRNDVAIAEVCVAHTFNKVTAETCFGLAGFFWAGLLNSTTGCKQQKTKAKQTKQNKWKK